MNPKHVMPVMELAFTNQKLFNYFMKNTIITTLMVFFAVIVGLLVNLYFEVKEMRKNNFSGIGVAEKYHQEKMAEFMKNKVCHHVEMQVIKF
jgi:hypothetical protein